MKPFYADFDDDIKAILLAQVRNLWTHASTAIEGNSLTLGDTAFVLEEGLTVAGKPLRDHQEVYGHAKGIEIVYGFLDSDSLQEKDILALHRTILTEVVTDIFKPVGSWKNESNFTNYTGTDGQQHWRQFPEPDSIPGLMRQWLTNFNSFYAQPLDQSTAASAYAKLHLDFVTIHPFFDGNGRMARLLANLPVLKSGFPPIVVPSEARQQYQKAISEYQETIANFAELRDMNSLPNNQERTRFGNICANYWEPTMTMVSTAREVQAHKNSQSKTTDTGTESGFEL